jgi:hypothetical protein
MTDESIGAPGGTDSEEAGSAGRPPQDNKGSRQGSPHTSTHEGHPAGEEERGDRDVGGPTSPQDPPDEDVTGGGKGTKDSGLEPDG